jgi:hypothetical protein
MKQPVECCPTPRVHRPGRVARPVSKPTPPDRSWDRRPAHRLRYSLAQDPFVHAPRLASRSVALCASPRPTDGARPHDRSNIADRLRQVVRAAHGDSTSICHCVVTLETATPPTPCSSGSRSHTQLSVRLLCTSRPTWPPHSAANHRSTTGCHARSLRDGSQSQPTADARDRSLGPTLPGPGLWTASRR